MKTKRILGLTILIAVVIGAMFITITVLGRGTKDQIPDTQEIQETIRLSYEVESEVARTFDISLFSSIYVNDSRGPKITNNALA
jgi:hypothetical protein